MSTTPPPPPPPGESASWSAEPPKGRAGGCLRVVGIVALVVVGLGVVGAVLGGDDEDATPPRDAAASGAADTDETDAATGDAGGTVSCQAGDGVEDTRNLCLYPERPDRQDDDHEAELGAPVRLAGYTAALVEARIEDQFDDPGVVVGVRVENRDDEAQAYNLFHWRIQTTNGQVLDPTINLRDDSLGSGDLVPGGSVTGSIAFDVGPGEYFVIYKPDPFNAARGIWRIEVE